MTSPRLPPTPSPFDVQDFRDAVQRALGDEFVIERELGGGGMSRVFVAHDVDLGRRVAVKVLSPDLAATVSVERFRREILLAAALQHPHIVGVLNAGDAGGLPYFTMPFVEGESLRARIARGPLPIAQTVSIMRDVARALAYAHGRGVVHRDIKPDNVLLAGGSACVADFGVAKALSAALGERVRSGGGTLTLVGTSLGTPAYMAPEQAAGDPSTDHRADIYAFGVMAYELLTGKPPFHGRTPQQLLAAQLTERPASLASLRERVPAALDALVMRCLEKEPSARPQTAQEIVDALDDREIVSGAFSSPEAPSLRTIASVRRRRTVVFAAIAAVLLAGVVGTTLAWRGRTAESAAARGAATATTVGAAPATNAAAPERSVAVLPLVGLGGDSAETRLGAALSDQISSALAQVPGLRVASRTAAERALLTAKGTEDIARALNVRTLVEGTVQREGTRVRVTARLVDTSDGFMLWADVYDGSTNDLLGMQQYIATSIATALAERFDEEKPPAP